MAGWAMILVHSIAALFTQLRGVRGGLIYIVYSVALVWAGLLFSHAAMPQRGRPSSRWLLGSLGASSFVYMTVLCLSPGRHWAMNLAAALVTVCPLTVTLASIRGVNDPRRWVVVAICAALTTFLLIFQNRHPYGSLVAWNGFLFTVYIGSCFFTLWTYRRATAGAVLTFAGFLAWAMVFILEPLQQSLWPQIHIESEIWHLPAFVVAMGMLLLLLENQLKHNRYLALHDELTGLPNRRLFQDRLENALSRARRTGKLLGLLLIDLDLFKEVNDRLGHQAGDTLLQQVSALFGARVRSSDTVARTGGDEFSVILEDPVSRAEAENVGNSLQRILSEPLQLGDTSVCVGASVGVAIFPDDADDADLLCRVADLRMYETKHGCGGLETRARRSNPSRVPASASP